MRREEMFVSISCCGRACHSKKHSQVFPLFCLPDSNPENRVDGTVYVEYGAGSALFEALACVEQQGEYSRADNCPQTPSELSCQVLSEVREREQALSMHSPEHALLLARASNTAHGLNLSCNEAARLPRPPILPVTTCRIVSCRPLYARTLARLAARAWLPDVGWQIMQIVPLVWLLSECLPSVLANSPREYHAHAASSPHSRPLVTRT